MHIALVISSLGMGGAERSLTTLANQWVAQGHSIDLLTFASPDAPQFFPLDKRVNIVFLSALADSPTIFDASLKNLKRISTLRKQLVAINPDAIVSFVDQTNISTIIASAFSGIPVIVAERTDPTQHSIGLVWSTLRNITYPFADAIAVQTNAVMEAIPSLWRTKAVVIPNAIASPTETPVAPPVNKPFAFAAGRLSHEKGFDILIEGFAKIANKFPQWMLIIAGDGPEREKLTKQVNTCGLNDRVQFLGVRKDIHDLYQQADIFVLPSRYEGFPNALCEAMAMGTAVIATDCHSGPKDIVKDAVDGFLVASENSSELARSLEHLMSNEAIRKEVGNNATRIKSTLGIGKVISMWNGALEKIISRKRQAKHTE